MEFELPYYISNNGDGSASLVPCPSKEQATAKDDDQNENEGWAEPSVGVLRLRVGVDGTLFYNGYDRDLPGFVWLPVKMKESK